VQLILHIGQQKTGSTYLQHYLSIKRDFLKKSGYLYPKSLGDLKQRSLCSEPENLILNNSNLYRNFINEINLSKPKVIILSEENIIHLKPEIIELIEKRLKPLSNDIKIIVYLRRQEDHLLSLYQQNVRGKRRKTIRELIDTDRLFKKHNYYDIVNRWKKAIPNADLILRPYGNLINNNIIEDFCQFTSCPFDSEYKNFDFAVANKSFDAASIELIRQLNILEEDEKIQLPHNLKRQIRVFLKFKERGNKFQLSHKDKMLIWNRNIKNNTLLCQEYNNVELSNYLLPKPEKSSLPSLYNQDIKNEEIIHLLLQATKIVE